MGKKLLTVFVVLATIAFFGVIAVVASKSISPSTSTPKPTPFVQGATDEEVKKPEPTIIEIFTQPVLISLPGKDYETAVNGTEVVVGTKIKTEKGGRAQILYPNKSVTRIDENSEISVVQLTKDENFSPAILIEAGKVWSRIAKLLGNEGYETKTGTTVAAIRGTSYGHAIDKAKNQDVITSIKNGIKVNCTASDQTGEVKENQKGTFNCKDKTKPAIQTLTAKELLEAWIKFNSEKDDGLDLKYGAGTYGDKKVLGASATPTPTVKPTTTPTPTPTATATATSTSSPNPPPPAPSPDPDLTIFFDSNPTISCTSIDCGTITAKFTIKNDSPTDINSSFQIIMSVVDTQIPPKTLTISNLTGNTIKNFNETLGGASFCMEGTCTLTVKVDEPSTVTETNESNNSVSDTVQYR